VVEHALKTVLAFWADGDLTLAMYASRPSARISKNFSRMRASIFSFCIPHFPRSQGGLEPPVRPLPSRPVADACGESALHGQPSRRWGHGPSGYKP
jgi:hypothetical protein